MSTTLQWLRRRLTGRGATRAAVLDYVEPVAAPNPEARASELEEQIEREHSIVREVLATNSVLVDPEAPSAALMAALQQTFGHPGLAETMLRALKRTGAITVYRDAIEETVRVRFAVTRRDREGWPQAPWNGPETVELDADGETVVPRKMDPDLAATPPLPQPPEYQYSRLGLQPTPRDLGLRPEAEVAIEPAPPESVPVVLGGSAPLGVRPFGGVDPRKMHLFVPAADSDDAPCVSCGLSNPEGPHDIG